MLRLKSKFAVLSMLGMLGFSLAGCGKKDDHIVDNDVYFYYDDKDETDSNEIDTNNDNINIIYINNGTISVNAIETVTAKCDVNIRETPIDGNVLKVLLKGESLPLLEKLDNGWYAVKFDGGVAYICGKYLSVTTEYEITSSIKDIYYTNDTTELKVPACFSNSGKEETISIDKNVCVEVYGEEGNSYIACVDGHIGYIGRENLTKLSGEFAVIDLSDKTITLYRDNEVVSVLPATINIDASNAKGLFYIFEIKTDRCLIGKDYQVYVDYVAYYNGGSSYITYGSDGGVNVPEESIDEVRKTLHLSSEIIVQQ